MQIFSFIVWRKSERNGLLLKENVVQGLGCIQRLLIEFLRCANFMQEEQQ